MQKKLIALALASLAGTAFAQSNVTIYGVADATFENVRATDGGTAGRDYVSRNRINSNSSYVGFKGVEDLGNGLKAVFQFENSVALDANVGMAGARDTFVGLSGGFGTVAAGLLTGPGRALGAKMDINSGATGIGANTALIGKLGGGRGASAFDTRLENAVAYVSPNFAGFNAVVAHSTGFTAGSNTVFPAGTFTAREAAGNGNAGGVAGTNTAQALGLNYENGPIYAAYAYTRVAIAGGNNDLLNHRLGGQYKFGVAQVGLLWDRTEAQATDARQNVWYLSGKFNVTPAGAIIAQYGRAQDAKNIAGDQSAVHYVVGYEHSLSKRTILKAVYSQINNDTNANYDLFAAVGGAGAAAVAADSNVRGLAVGVRHSF